MLKPDFITFKFKKDKSCEREKYKKEKRNQ